MSFLVCSAAFGTCVHVYTSPYITQAEVGEEEGEAAAVPHLGSPSWFLLLWLLLLSFAASSSSVLIRELLRSK